MNKSDARMYCSEQLNNIINKQLRDMELSTKVNSLINSYNVVGSYMPIKNEIILNLNNNVNIVYPKVIGKVMKFYENKYGFTKSSFGIDEPVIIDQEEVIPEVLIVPCVGFCGNYRLGYGGGFYDKYLALHSCTTIGVAYSETMVLDLEVESHDLALETIISI